MAANFGREVWREKSGDLAGKLGGRIVKVPGRIIKVPGEIGPVWFCFLEALVSALAGNWSVNGPMGRLDWLEQGDGSVGRLDRGNGV